jgi:hypothetical protein
MSGFLAWSADTRRRPSRRCQAGDSLYRRRPGLRQGQVEDGGGDVGQAAGVQVGQAALLDERLRQRTGAGVPSVVGVVSLAGQCDVAAVGVELLCPGPVPRLLDWVVDAVELALA